MMPFRWQQGASMLLKPMMWWIFPDFLDLVNTLKPNFHVLYTLLYLHMHLLRLCHILFFPNNKKFVCMYLQGIRWRQELGIGAHMLLQFDLGEWAIALHGKGTCPREVACVEYPYLLDILHSETTNRNCDNISMWTKWNLHFGLLTIKFNKIIDRNYNNDKGLMPKKLVSMLLDGDILYTTHSATPHWSATQWLKYNTVSRS